jgi:UDP-N-acetylglucosamine acyltransferase
MGRKIHPTAILDARAELGEGVVVGPHVVIEGDVVIGDNCELMTGVVIRRYTTMGPGNVVHPLAVLGGEPQDYKFGPNNETYLRIGAGNVFREHVTLNRATTPGGSTVIGSHCYFMTQSHVGHDSVVADEVILTNGAALGGHVQIGRRAVLSAHAGVHQFCWVGEMVMMRGNAGASQHVPPFVITKDINCIVGLNAVGLRRAEDITDIDRRQIKEAYRLLYRSNLTTREALAEMDRRTQWGAPAGRFREFVRRVVTAEPPYKRGLAADRSVRGQRDLD